MTNLPTLAKTWQFSINQKVDAQGSIAATEKRLIRTIKNLMKGFGTNPWTCSGSSNSSTAGMDGVDRWTTDADITKAAAASPHSWIVLRQTGIATNYEFCFDALASAGSATIVVSPSAGFTGGTTSARPTATDEIILISNTTWFSVLDTIHQIHAMQSTDGQCTRIQVWRGGVQQCLFWLFDKPQNPVSGWTNPSLSLALATGAASAAGGYASDYANIRSSKNIKGRGSATFGMVMTGEWHGILQSTTTLLAESLAVGVVPNQFDGYWDFYSVGVASDDVSHRGRHASIFDLWLGEIGMNDGDTFPSNASTKQFINLGRIILPWVGDSTIALLQ